MRRFDEQRWLIDNIIRANGIDWDQPRSLYIHAPCGIEANADFAGIRERVKKMADIGPVFAAVARRREAKANAAIEADRKVTARDNFFMAAVHWGAAQWPYDENDETNIAYNNKKRECYAKYAALADHHVEAVWVPFKDKAIPAWLHLPPNYSSGRLPVVIAVRAWTATRRSRSRSMATSFSTAAWRCWRSTAGPIRGADDRASLHHGELDRGRSGFGRLDRGAAGARCHARGHSGTSFGSLFGTVLTANELRSKACAATPVCQSPAATRSSREASPTFKKRFMYMSGITDEAEFDEFVKPSPGKER